MSALNMHVIRLTTPVYDDNKSYRGQLTLSLDLPRLRDIISPHTQAVATIPFSPGK